MSSSQTLRLVDRARYNEQKFLSIPYPTTPLAPSSVRVQTKLIGLTANNLSYCRLGSVMHWWSAYPLPPYTPAPYDYDSQYGVAPAWGYCTVLQSTIEGIPPGRIIDGFLPISSHAVDLQLRRADTMPNHYVETSPHRGQLMNLYQRYRLLPVNFDLNSSLAAWTVVFKVWEAGSSLARYVFPQDSSTPVHPFGAQVSPWTRKDADVSGACIICIASGTKTARAFIHQLAAIAAEKRPEYSLVEVTSGLVGCKRYLNNVPFPQKVLAYDNLVGAFAPHRKFVILDFGGRNNALAKVADAVKQVNPSAEAVCVAIGGEAKVYDEEAMVARRATAAKLQPVQMNATGIRDEAMKREGEPKYFQELDHSFETMVKQQAKDFNGRVLGVTLKAEHGLTGEAGVEGIWFKLCAGQVPGDDGMVVRLD